MTGPVSGRCSRRTGSIKTSSSGAHRGRAAIAAMLQRFHDTGSDYRWDFFDPRQRRQDRLCKVPLQLPFDSAGEPGRPVVFEGISQFLLTDDGLIPHYGEAFDRGVALVQLGFPAERIRRIVEKAAASQNATPEARAHLDRFSN